MGEGAEATAEASRLVTAAATTRRPQRPDARKDNLDIQTFIQQSLLVSPLSDMCVHT